MPDGDRWVVTTSGDRPFADVTREIAATGFDVAEVMDAIGVVTGSGSSSVADAVRRVPGVTDVSPDQPVDIGPPDSPSTW